MNGYFHLSLTDPEGKHAEDGFPLYEHALCTVLDTVQTMHPESPSNIFEHSPNLVASFHAGIHVHETKSLLP